MIRDMAKPRRLARRTNNFSGLDGSLFATQGAFLRLKAAFADEPSAAVNLFRATAN
jgi:hypothetical protein